jgi:hypothetical protein
MLDGSVYWLLPVENVPPVSILGSPNLEIRSLSDADSLSASRSKTIFQTPLSIVLEIFSSALIIF